MRVWLFGMYRTSLVLFLSGLQASAWAQTINFPVTQPSAAELVPKDFVGFGFESAFLPEYAGTKKTPNVFSQNLINSVSKRTGASSVIRIGGTSGDQLIYDPSLNVAKQVLPGNCSTCSGSWFYVSDSYFESFGNFPGQKISIQAPLGSQTAPKNLSNTLAITSRAYNAVGAANINAIAIGNEPAFYEPSLQQYVSDFVNYEMAMNSNLSLPAGLAIYEASDDDSVAATRNSFSPAELFPLGINNNSLIKTAAEHYYQVMPGIVNPSLQDLLMNHTAIVEMMKPYQISIDYLRESFPDVSYILSETGDALHYPMSTFAAILGSALWSVDFQLYAMSVGVKRVDGSMRPLTEHALWQPVAANGYPPQVRAPYYAQPFVADFISNSSSPTYVTNLDLNDSLLSAYAAYSDNTLQRVAIVNLLLWNETNATPPMARLGYISPTRPSTSVTLPVPTSIKSVRVERLTSPTGAYANSTITWAGESWSYATDHGVGHVAITNHTETYATNNGMVEFEVFASEAVMVFLYEDNDAAAVTSTAVKAVKTGAKTRIGIPLMLLYWWCGYLVL